jgi:hypothetical protein
MERDNAMVQKNYSKLDKIMLDVWIKSTLNKTLSKYNTKFGFTITRIRNLTS